MKAVSNSKQRTRQKSYYYIHRQLCISFDAVFRFSDDLQLVSKRGSTCPLIQIPNTDTGSNTDSASKQHDNLSQNADPSFTNQYQETSLCDRDCSDSRRSSFEICYCNGSNTR